MKSVINKLETMARDVDFNPEGDGELTGENAVMEFLHEPVVTKFLENLAVNGGRNHVRHNAALLGSKPLPRSERGNR